MDSHLPPDPYKALGLSRDVDSATIKQTYRKLVLKCHPDKVTDESLKKQKQEEFHKIQEAYELIGDDEKRSRYDAEVTLDALRKEKAARATTTAAPDTRAASYNLRTAAPAGYAASATRYEESKSSSRSYDDRYYEERSRSKYDTYDPYPKGSSSRSSREKESPIKVTRIAVDRTRSDYKKSRDKERERDRRYVASERERESDPSGDEKARYEAEYKRRSDDARRRQEEDDARKQAEAVRRKADDRRYDDSKYDKYDRKQKTTDQQDDAFRHIHRSKVDAERPSPSRTTSSRDVRPEYYDPRDSRSRRDRPDTVRRSSARPKERSERDRDRKGPEIVEWDLEDRDRKAPPTFKHSTSSPAEIHVPRAAPHRSFTTDSSRDHRRSDTSPTPVMRRSETMPSVPHASSSRRRETTVRPSGLRESVTPSDSPSSSTEAYPTIPPAMSTTKRYYYSTPGGGVTLAPEDMGMANGHRTVLREPERMRHRSPSPLTRPPIGANRHVEPVSASYTTAAPKVAMVPPPLGRAATINLAEARVGDDRGRARFFGEVDPDHLRRENARRQTSFSPDQVSYSQKIRPEDIKFSSSAKPSLGRHATYVC